MREEEPRDGKARENGLGNELKIPELAVPLPNLPASPGQEDAQTKPMHIPRAAVRRMAPSKSWQHAPFDIGPQSLVLGAGCRCRQRCCSICDRESQLPPTPNSRAALRVAARAAEGQLGVRELP